jgi:hypothetical protein
MEYIIEVIKNTIFILVASRIVLVAGLLYVLFRVGYRFRHAAFPENIKRFWLHYRGKSLSK